MGKLVEVDASILTFWRKRILFGRKKHNIKKEYFVKLKSALKPILNVNVITTIRYAEGIKK